MLGASSMPVLLSVLPSGAVAVSVAVESYSAPPKSTPTVRGSGELQLRGRLLW